MLLYHFSEDPDIVEFIPRSPQAHPDTEPFIWTIDQWHAPLYYMPRDCPRVCFWPLPTTTPEDREIFFSSVSGRMVIAIESAWYDRVAKKSLYQYTFDDDSFFPTHDHGVYLSREQVKPKRVDPVGNLVKRLIESDIELRFCPSLAPLGERIIQTSLHFSLIRMRNAAGWQGATGSPTIPQ